MKPAKPNRTAPKLFLGLFCVLCAVLVLRHCFCMEHRFDRLSEVCAVDAGPGARPPSGILHPIASDGYAWIRLVQDMLNNREWRIKHTGFDNAPYGRDVHWHSGFAWWLAGLGWAYHAIHSIPLDRAIERAAVWANSILLVAGILLLPLLVYRRFGVRAAAVLALCMIACGDFYENFIPGYPDHHGEISLTALCSILFLLMAGAGWIRNETEKQPDRLFPESTKEARFYILLAALSGAAGLWISAVSQILLIAGIGLGILASVLAFSTRARAEGVRYYPDAWALWGRAGAAFALFFYALEYFPDNTGMQLLANHPLYALLWLGSGEMLAVVTRLLHEKRKPGKKEVYRLVIAGALIVSYPATIAAGNPAWWSLRDPFMIALHNDILEFKPLLSRLGDGSIDFAGWLWTLALFLAPGVVLLFRRTTPAAHRAVVLFTLAPALLFTSLSLYQTRWSLHCGPVFVALLPVALRFLFHHIGKQKPKGAQTAWRLFAVVVLLLAVSPVKKILRAEQLASPSKRMGLSQGEAGDLLARDIAYAIKNGAKPGRKIVVLGSPNVTLRVCYFGRFSGIGTLYWENLSGLKAAAELFGTPDEPYLRQTLRERGVTHIVFVDAPGFMSSYVEPYFNLFNLERKNQTLEKSFAYKAFYKKEFPQWLRPVPYRDNLLPRLLRAEVLLLEVVDEGLGGG